MYDVIRYPSAKEKEHIEPRRSLRLLLPFWIQVSFLKDDGPFSINMQFLGRPYQASSPASYSY